MSPEQIIAVITALLTGASNPAFDALHNGSHDTRYPIKIENCPRPLGPLEIEGKTVVCGRINVPEDHDNDTGNTVPLSFAVLKAKSEAPAPDPVIYLHGGPGGYTVQDIPFNARLFDFLRGRRDVVLFDQRASGISDQTIACYNEFAEDIVKFAKPDEGTMFDADQPLAKCVTETRSSGVDLSLYNTTQSAKDIRAIMDALGYPAYNAFGISYGTKLGQELLRSAPDGLRSLAIDSISRVDNPAYDTNGVPPDQALGWVVDYCMADTNCAKAFPDLEADINAAGERLAQEPKLVIAGKEVGPEWVSAILEKNNKTVGPFTAYMPQIFTELAKGETKTADKLLAGGFDPDTSPAALTVRLGAGLGDSDKAVTEVILMQAEQLRSLQTSSSKLLSTLSDDVSPAGAAETEQLLDSALSEIAKGMEAADLLAMSQSYARFIGSEPDREAIEAFVRAYVPEADLYRILGIVTAMTDEDVAAFYERASIDAAKITSGTRMYFTLGIIACQEDFPFNTRDGFNAVSDQYRFSVIDPGVRANTWPIYGFCDLFEHHTREGFHEPVVSDIPVLAMAGTKDTQTNPDAAEKVSRTLSNSQAVLFPEAGHAVIHFSQCAKDIAAAFIEHPNEPVNTACTEKLKPKFYIPPKVNP